MERRRFVVATDRGGHLHNAKRLLEQMGVAPDALVVTQGPELSEYQKESPIFVVPYLFSWWGHFRFLNPVKMIWHAFVSLRHVLVLRPAVVISLGATDVVFFCYFAWLWGAQVYHVECMNQVVHPSLTGRILYPICEKLYVQWNDLLSHFGGKASYMGWVLT